jgi:adenine phosphoribosyltransferase
MNDRETAIRAAIRDIPDFPKPGILFKDITPVLADGALFRDSISLLCLPHTSSSVDKVVGIDARGFIFGAAMADRLGAGFVPARKVGKLPWRTRRASYSLEYGDSHIELHEDAVKAGETVLIVDDLMATGGTAAAAIKLVQQSGASILGVAVLVELTFLHGREKVPSIPVWSVVSY